MIAGKNHSINEVKIKIYNQLRMDEYYAEINQTEIDFHLKWEKLYADLSTLFSH